MLASVSPSAGAAEEADDVPPPEVWSGDATSRAVSVNLNREALLPVPEVFNFIGLDGLSTYGSSNQAARASIFFPGNGAIIGPGLACGTFGGQFPSQFKPILDTCLQYQYPLTVFADEFRPDGSTNGSLAFGTPKSDISASATTARAHAALDGANTDAVVQDLRVLGIPPFGPTTIPGVSQALKLDTSIVDIDSVTSRTDQRIVRGGLVTTAKVTMSGVKVIGGLLRMASLTSESRVTDDAAGKRTASADFHASGVTVAGVPAQLTNKGIVLGSPDNKVPVPAAAIDAAKEVLKALDVSFATLPTEEVLDKNGAARASVGGLVVEYARDVQGLPLLPSPIGGQLDPNGLYTLTVQLGLTGVVGSAENFGLDEDLGGFDDLDDTLDDFGDVNDFTDDNGSFDDGSFGALPDAGRRRLGAGGSRDDDAGSRTLVRSVANNFGGRLGFLYLTLMFAVLALCVTPRLAVPARLPGPKE